MRLRNSADKYGAISIFLHWLTALLVATAWILGVLGDELPRGAARQSGLFVHISAGLLIIALMLIRLTWRIFDRPPPLEGTRLGPWAGRATQLAHVALYALLLAAPIAGVVVRFADGDAIPILGLFEIPSPWVKDHAFAETSEEVHELLAHALILVALAHSAAALVHHWVFRDGTLKRMLPGVER